MNINFSIENKNQATIKKNKNINSNNIIKNKNINNTICNQTKKVLVPQLHHHHCTNTQRNDDDISVGDVDVVGEPYHLHNGSWISS